MDLNVIQYIVDKVDLAAYMLFGAPALVIIIALVKVARLTGLPSKYAPAMSLLAGSLVGMGLSFQSGDPLFTGLPIGIVLGAIACGAYDAGKMPE